MRRVPRVWVGRAVIALLVAAAVNLALSALSVDHDGELVTLLAAATVAAAVLALEAIDASTRLPWTARRADSRPTAGEDTPTAMYRHVVEVHLTSREADDAIVWQIADLARQRLRQVHALRPDEDPARTLELLGPRLAGWVALDRLQRYQPDQRHRRYSVAELGEAVARIEDL